MTFHTNKSTTNIFYLFLEGIHEWAGEPEESGQRVGDGIGWAGSSVGGLRWSLSGRLRAPTTAVTVWSLLLKLLKYFLSQGFSLSW